MDPYPTRVYGPLPNPSLMVRDEYNNCNYKGANNVRIGDEPVAVNAPYRGETDDEEVRPVPAAPHTRPEETGV